MWFVNWTLIYKEQSEGNDHLKHMFSFQQYEINLENDLDC